MSSSETISPVGAHVRPNSAGDSLHLEQSSEFVNTPYVQDMSDRALAYLEAGYAVHFAGPPGVGKTCLAFHVAARLGQEVVLIHGDDEFGSSDLVGRDSGYRRSKIVDNYIHSVVKTEEEMQSLWVNNRLTNACRNGSILIYDEFNRSRPEANNVLLSVLSEGILNMPRMRSGGKGYLGVHPRFRAIFTSNPEEYAGVHKAQDALMDRVITIQLEHYDRDTEVEIVVARAGISFADASIIIDIVRKLRGDDGKGTRPTIRAAIAIGKVMAVRNATAHLQDTVFRWACRDVLSRDIAKVSRDGRSLVQDQVDGVVREVLGHIHPKTVVA